MAPDTKKIYLLSPVRNATDAEKKFIDNYVHKLESRGHKVHYPGRRDTNQDDVIGLKICTSNRIAIKNSTEIHAYWNGKSQGSFFDIGMAFMAEKPLHIINLLDIHFAGKDDFDNFVFRYACKISTPESEEFYKKLIERRDEIRRAPKISYKLADLNKEFLLDFGMSFMAEKPVELLNKEEVEKQRTPHKSFQNVLLELDNQYKQLASK